MREKIFEYIKTKYKAKEEYPWYRYPNYAVFRHEDNQKWFALVANIPLCKLKPRAKPTEMVDIINIKIDTNQTDNILKKRGFYPAYHMNKKSWATIILDGTVTDKTIEEFICDSFTRA